MDDTITKYADKNTSLEAETVYLNQIIKTQLKLEEAGFNLDAFMKLVVEQMQLLTPSTGVVVELVEGDEMVYRAAIGTVASYMGMRLKVAGSISGLCVKKNEILRSDDTEKDPRVNREACRIVKARSLVVAPLACNGTTVGVLKILSDHAYAFTEKDVQTLQLMAGFVASGLMHQIYFETNEKLLHDRTKALRELNEAQDKLNHLAHYDYLTDLPNRKLFSDKLHEAMTTSKNNHSLFAILFLDIDHFKEINDNLGHNIGDALLINFANRLKKRVRPQDLVARIGGDEFIILLNNLNTHEDAFTVAKKILHNMQEQFQFENTSLKITPSIGISFYQGQEFTSDELIKQADIALYDAKKSGRNRFKVYEPDSESNLK